MRKQTMLLTALLIAITIAVGTHYTLYAGTFDPDIETINFSIEDAVAGGPALAGTLAGVASAQARLTDGSTGDPQSSPLGGSNAQVAPADVVLVIDKFGPVDPVEAGEILTYLIVVENTGDTDATGVFVADTLPVGVTFLSSSPPNTCFFGLPAFPEGVLCDVGGVLGVGDEPVGRFIAVTVDANTPHGTILVNTALLVSNEGTAVTTEDTIIVVSGQNLLVNKTVDDDTPIEGDTILYTITVTNEGPNDATNVEVADLLPAGVTYFSDDSGGDYNSATGVWDVGDLTDNTSEKLEITATVDAGTAGDTITNTATVTAAGEADETSGDDVADAPITVQPSADLTVAKGVDNAAPNEGDIIVYTITVSNGGPDDATGVQVTDKLPDGVTYVSHSGGTYSTSTGMWIVGTVANASSTTLNITATVDAGTRGQTITNDAAVTAVDQADPNPGDEQDSADISVPLLADLTVIKGVDNAAPNEGDTIVYTITVSNGGPDDATNVEVTDELPDGVTYVSHSGGDYSTSTGMWIVGTVANGTSTTLNITATVNAGTATDTITNTAAVTAVDQVDPAPGEEQGSAPITVQGADLSVDKIVDDPNPKEDGTIVYTITVTNNGPDAATNVKVTDLLPGGVTYVSDDGGGTYSTSTGMWIVGTVANGTSTTLNITATVDAGTGGDTITNTATVTAVDQADPSPGDEQSSVDIIVQSADLTVDKSVDDANPKEGDTIVYTITVSNAGPNDATNVEVTDVLPSGVTYVSDDGGGTYSTSTGMWIVGTVANASSTTLNITATVDAGTHGQTITNDAAVTAVDLADPNPGDEQSSVDITVQSADLTVDKSVDNAAPNEGDTIVYTITVSNAGPNDATNVEVTDVLPSGVTYVSDDGGGTYSTSTGMWIVGTVANASSTTLNITATVDAGTHGQTITNDAAVTAVDLADPNPGDEQSSVDITVQSADLTVDKSVDNAAPNEGNTIVYTITVSNGGPDDATNVEVTDVLPAGVTYVSDDGGGSYDSGTGVWMVSTVLSSGSTTLNITATVDAGTVGDTITNDAEVTAVDQADPNPGDEQDDASITVQSADLSLTKIVDLDPVQIGGELTYTITVSNGGPDDATNVEVTDVLPAGVTYDSDDGGGSYDSGTGVWDVGTVANGTSATLKIVVTVDDDTKHNTVITNTAAVTAVDQADPTPGDEQDDAQTTAMAFMKIVTITSDDEAVEGDQYFVVVAADEASNVTIDGQPMTPIDGDVSKGIPPVPDILVKMYGLDKVGSFAATHVMLSSVSGEPVGPMPITVDVNGGELSDVLNIVRERTNRNFYLFPSSSVNYVGLGLIPDNTSLDDLMDQEVSNANPAFEAELGRPVTLGDMIQTISAYSFSDAGGFKVFNTPDPLTGAPGLFSDLSKLEPYQGMLVTMRENVTPAGDKAKAIAVFAPTVDPVTGAAVGVPIKMNIVGPFLSTGSTTPPVTRELRFGFNLIAPHAKGDAPFEDVFRGALIPEDRELILNASTFGRAVTAGWTGSDIIAEIIEQWDIITEGETIEVKQAYWTFIARPADDSFKPIIAPAD